MSKAHRVELPNFDYIRLAAATAVLFSHAFLIADGHEQNEPLVRLLGKGNILGIYGVFTFFVISGFLIAQSASTSPSLRVFVWSRVLRIYPALIGCTLFCGAVLGSYFVNTSLLDYWTKLLPLRYAAAATAFLGVDSGSIPGVVFYPDGGWLAQSMNGSLWTLLHELICYGIVGGLLAVRQFHGLVVTAICIACCPLLFSDLPVVPKLVGDFLFVAPSFAFGALLYFARRLGPFPFWPSALCLGLLAEAALHDRALQLFGPLAAYPLIAFATSKRFQLPSLKKLGDISYGLYLYGWPMEQVARALCGDSASWLSVFGIALPAAALLGFLSWHMLEKPALSLKQKLAPRSV